MKKMIVTIAAVMALVLGAVLPMTPVMAADDVCSDSSISDELKEAAGCNTSKKADEVVNSVLTVVLSFVGVIAVGVMIYGGVMYMTSNGDSGKVQRAKNIIMYGIIGMVVALLAYAIIHFISKGIGS